ncbi:DUF2510 domain-containing protein [Rhodococcus qingshengii]|uniref:DUF2510 domain-containing protein n=1 Tax=Rhodococcus qingshengii TaxID=334542 RepID=UPI00210A5A13|nr:DUF2510 domain-containing protein [Rhodococcus qingshengii]MCQ4148559.1 DUF2510 domain-containing protein [Rhodococcus qingshengii]
MTEPIEPTKKKRPKWQLILGAVVAVLVALIAIGAIFGEDKKDEPAVASAAPSSTTTAAATTTSTTAPVPTSTVSSITTVSSTTAKPSAPAVPAAKTSDPRCAPASDELTFLVSSGLSTDGYELINGTVIQDGNLKFYGATTVDSTGKVKNRSDVWVVKDNLVYASSGGARNGSIWTKASDAPLKISAGDARVQAVDQCVVSITTN